MATLASPGAAASASASSAAAAAAAAAASHATADDRADTSPSASPSASNSAPASTSRRSVASPSASPRPLVRELSSASDLRTIADKPSPARCDGRISRISLVTPSSGGCSRTADARCGLRGGGGGGRASPRSHNGVERLTLRGETTSSI